MKLFVGVKFWAPPRGFRTWLKLSSATIKIANSYLVSESFDFIQKEHQLIELAAFFCTVDQNSKFSRKNVRILSKNTYVNIIGHIFANILPLNWLNLGISLEFARLSHRFSNFTVCLLLKFVVVLRPSHQKRICRQVATFFWRFLQIFDMKLFYTWTG